MILTHYLAGLLVAAQGIIYLAKHRRRALAISPAAFAFAPVALWLLAALPRLQSFAGLSGTPLLNFGRAVTVINFLFGNIFVIAVLLLFLVGLFLWRRLGMRCASDENAAPASSSAARYAVLASFLAAAAMLAIGFYRPMITFRYAMPIAPGILLGCALIFEPARKRWLLSFLAPCLLFAAATVQASTWPLNHKDHISFEAAADSVIAAGAKHLVFFWDNRARLAAEPDLLARGASFSFERKGYDIDVSMLKLAEGEDPNTRFIASADKDRTALLWIYETASLGYVAKQYPPRIAELDPSWRCHDSATREKRTFVVLVCVKPE